MDEWFTRKPLSVREVDIDDRGTRRQVEIADFLCATADHYAGSFGAQWARYRDVQIDRLNGTQASYRHLAAFTLGDPGILRGKTILEIGSGAGRFTDHLVTLGKHVITVDPSAIDSNAALGAPNLVAARADLFDVPVRRERIDVVFCRGVLQHTADPRRALMRLFDYVRPGGLVMFDIYPLRWHTPFAVKYWWRPFTRRIPPHRFMRLAETWVPRLLRFKHTFVTPLLPRGKVGAHVASQLVPVADFTAATDLGDEQRRLAWSVLDTVDMYTPRFDQPMTWNGVMRALRDARASDLAGDRSSFCFRATAPL